MEKSATWTRCGPWSTVFCRYRRYVELEQLLRLRGHVEASATEDPAESARGLVAAYPRIRADVVAAVGADDQAEFERLFPSELKSKGQPPMVQAGEAQLYLSQMVGWLDGLIEGALLDRRKAEAEAKRIGFE